MEKNFSLSELKEIQEAIQEKIDVYQNNLKRFYNIQWYRNKSGQNLYLLGSATITLDECKDKSTGKPLSDASIHNIDLFTNLIVKLTERKIFLMKKIDDIIYGKPLATKIRQISKISDDQRINDFIDTALKLGKIPKGTKYIDKTLYKKLNDKHFLIELSNAIQKRMKSKKILESKLTLLADLNNEILHRLERVNRSKTKYGQQPKTFEYNDSVKYQTDRKKRKFSVDY